MEHTYGNIYLEIAPSPQPVLTPAPFKSESESKSSSDDDTFSNAEILFLQIQEEIAPLIRN